MSEPQTVYILTRTPTNDNELDGEMQIVAVFKTAEALEKRIVALVRGNKLKDLSGLGMEKHIVMES